MSVCLYANIFTKNHQLKQKTPRKLLFKWSREEKNHQFQDKIDTRKAL